MINQLSGWLARNAKGWLLLVSFAVMAFCMAVLLPGAEAAITATGAGGPIDLMFFPLPGQSYAVVDALGEAGRASYRLTELTVDVIYPLSYTFFCSLLITLLLQRALDKNSPLQRLNVLPFGALIFDLLENIGVITMLSIHPDQPAALGFYTMAANGIKWLFVISCILTLLFALAAFGWKKIRK